MLSLFSSVSVTGCPIGGHSVLIERLNDSLKVIFHERFQAECSFVPMLLWLSGLFSLVRSFVRVAQRTRVGVGKGVFTPLQPNVKNPGLVGLRLLFRLQTPTTGVWAPFTSTFQGPVMP